MKKYIYVIYDCLNFDVWEIFDSKKDALKKYNSHYNGFTNIRCYPYNIKFIPLWIRTSECYIRKYA